MAISIPIFTGRLKKARLATNQSNTRAEYTATTTQYMLDYADTVVPDEGIFYKYDTNNGTATKTVQLAHLDLKNTSTDITTWKIETKVNSTALGDKTAKTWTVILDKDGTVTGYSATF